MQAEQARSWFRQVTPLDAHRKIYKDGYLCPEVGCWGISSAAFEPFVSLDTECLSIKERIKLVKYGSDLRDGSQWLAFNNSIDVKTGK